MSESNKMDRYIIENVIQRINAGEISLNINPAYLLTLKTMGYGLSNKDLFSAIQMITNDVKSLEGEIDTSLLYKVMKDCSDFGKSAQSFSAIPHKDGENTYYEILSVDNFYSSFFENCPFANKDNNSIYITKDYLGVFMGYMASNGFDISRFAFLVNDFEVNPELFTATSKGKLTDGLLGSIGELKKADLKSIDYEANFIEKEGVDNEDLGLIYFKDTMPFDVLDEIEEIGIKNSNSLQFRPYYTRNGSKLVLSLGNMPGVIEYLKSEGYDTSALEKDIDDLTEKSLKAKKKKSNLKREQMSSTRGLADRFVSLSRELNSLDTRLFDASVPFSKGNAIEYANALKEMAEIEKKAVDNRVLQDICNDSKHHILINFAPVSMKNPRNKNKKETFYKISLSTVSVPISQAMAQLDEGLDKTQPYYSKKAFYCLVTLLKSMGYVIGNEGKLLSVFSDKELKEMDTKVLDINILGNLFSIRVLGLKYIFKLLFHTSYDIDYNPILSFFTVSTRQFYSVYKRAKELNEYKIIDDDSLKKFEDAYNRLTKLQEKLNTIELIDTSHLAVQPTEEQIDVAKQMLHLKHFILADKTGSGKTKTTVLACESVLAQFPEAKIIIVVPATIKINWVREIREVNAKAKTQIIVAGDSINTSANYFIINYDILSRYFSDLVALRPMVTVIDEAHNCNAINPRTGEPNSIRAEKALALCRVAHMSYPLTATPLRNKVWDVFPILKMIDHELGDSYDKFKRKYVAGDGDAINIKDLHKKISTHMSRRVGDYQVPQRIYMPVKVDLKTYDKLVNAFMEKGNYTGSAKVLVLICALKKYLAYAKIGATYEMGLNLLKTERQIVIFTDYSKVIEELTEKFEDVGFNVTRITGKETLKQKQQNIDDFTAGIYDIILCNRKAGGVGCNLQVAYSVIFNDLFWVPEDVIQAEGRINRYGQTHEVKSIFLYCDEAFIDSRLQEVMEHKLAMSESVIDGLDDLSFNTSLYKEVANDFCASLGIVNIKDDSKLSALNIKDLLDKYDDDTDVNIEELNLGVDLGLNSSSAEEKPNDDEEFLQMYNEFTAIKEGRYENVIPNRVRRFNASKDARKYVASILELSAGNNTEHDVKIGYNNNTKTFTVMYELTNKTNHNKLLFLMNVQGNKYWYSTMRCIEGKYYPLQPYISVPLNYLTERTDREKAFRNFLYALENSKSNPTAHMTYIKQFVNYYIHYYKAQQANAQKVKSGNTIDDSIK